MEENLPEGGIHRTVILLLLEPQDRRGILDNTYNALWNKRSPRMVPNPTSMGGCGPFGARSYEENWLTSRRDLKISSGSKVLKTNVLMWKYARPQLRGKYGISRVYMSSSIGMRTSHTQLPSPVLIVSGYGRAGHLASRKWMRANGTGVT